MRKEDWPITEQEA